MGRFNNWRWSLYDESKVSRCLLLGNDHDTDILNAKLKDYNNQTIISTPLNSSCLNAHWNWKCKLVLTHNWTLRWINQEFFGYLQGSQ